MYQRKTASKSREQYSSGWWKATHEINGGIYERRYVKGRTGLYVLQKTLGVLRKKDGVYLPSKHDKKVFEDASKEFGLSVSQCEECFDMIDKPSAEHMVNEAIQKGKALELCDEVLGGNGENPWGLKRILENFYFIISEINMDNLKQIYITVYKENVPDPPEEDLLLSLELQKNISIIKRNNGDIVISDANNNFTFDVKNIVSAMRGFPAPNGERAFINHAFQVLLLNGNIVSAYIIFEP